MKKVLFLVVALFMFALIGCDQASSNTEPYDYSSDIQSVEDQLQAQIDEIEQQILELQATIDNLTVVEGMNGRVSYYVNQVQELSQVLLSIKTEKDFLDKAKLPDYLFDDDGEFVDENTLCKLLSEKYFGNINYSIFDVAVGFRFQFAYVMSGSAVDQNDLIARTILMIEELRNYDFYIIGSSEINMWYALPTGSASLTFLVQTLLTDTIPIVPEIVVNKWLFTDYTGLTLDLAQVQAYYDSYVLNETFSGYVLNYD